MGANVRGRERNLLRVHRLVGTTIGFSRDETVLYDGTKYFIVKRTGTRTVNLFYILFMMLQDEDPKIAC